MKADKRTLFCLAILIIMFLASCSLAVTPRDPVEGDLAVKPSPVASPTVTVTDRASGSGNVTLSLSWEAVEGATQYEVLYQSEDQIFEGKWSSHRVSTNSASLTLSANEVFRITVVASNGYSESDAGGYALVSTINSIDEVSPVISAGIPSIIIRHPSVSFNGEKILDLVYTIRITNADGSQAMYADGKPVEELIIPNSTYYSFADALAPSSEYAVDVSMYIDNDGTAGYSEGDELIDSSTASFSTDVDSYPDVVSAISAFLTQTDAGDAAFRLSFTAPPVKKGLEDQDVKRRFRITRNEIGGDSVVVLSETLPCESDGEDSFYLIDSQGLESNREYTYTVESYYFFSKGNAYNRQSEENGVESSPVHLLSVPENLEASIEGKETEYTVTLSFDFPFGLEEGHTISLERRETGLQSGSDWSSVESDNPSVDGERVTITSAISLSEDEARRSHSYSYRVTISDGNFTSTAISTPVSTTGTLTELDVIQNLASTSLPLAGKISLKWDYSEDGLAGTGLSAQDLTITLLRGQSPDYSDAQPVDGGFVYRSEHYVDSSVEDGVTYYYAISVGVSNHADYEGYNEVDYVSASSLAPVSSISASQGEFSDRIELSWSGVDGAKGYQVYYRAYGSEEDWILATEDICPTPVSDPSTGLWTASFTKDAGTSSAGLRYSFSVKPVDKEDNVSQNEPIATAVGNMLGPASIVVDVSRGEYSDSILVSWNAIPGATQYLVQGFNGEDEDAMEIFREIVVPDGAGMSVVFSTDNVSSQAEYGLSQSYWFSITPQYNSQSSVTSTERVEGWWVMPPKDVTASKAASSSVVFISWEPVDAAEGYNVYRRRVEKNSNGDYVSLEDWGRPIQYTSMTSVEDIVSSDFNSTDAYYEYTVSTFINGVEGPLQTTFIDEPQNPEGLKKNIGFPLYSPTQVRISDVEVERHYDYLSRIQFIENAYADSYQISSPLMSSPIVIDMSLEDSVTTIEDLSLAEAVEGSVYRDGKGNMLVFIERPHLVDSVYFQISVSSMVDESVFPNDNVSNAYSATLRPSSLRYIEMIALANSVLSEAIAPANAHYSGDWWYSGWESSSGYENPWTTTVGGGTVTTNVEDTNLGQQTEVAASIELSNVVLNMVRLSGAFAPTTGGTKLAYQTNPLYELISKNGPMTVELPLDYGTVQIDYQSVRVDNSAGTYVVSVDGVQSGPIPATNVEVLPL